MDFGEWVSGEERGLGTVLVLDGEEEGGAIFDGVVGDWPVLEEDELSGGVSTW